jgi:DNA (cytosine-5)-methyltransferase 1
VRYLSVCSGIEAATVAWHSLGWTPAGFAEIEPFPRAVLAHHYPEVPLHGDFTQIADADCADVDLLVGGTPCQSFSVAGLRGGLADQRGNLALEYLRLAERTRARWLVWENVPGVLSSNGGRDFGAILGGMVELGYGFAYRVLDAQYFGVPQRRRRVFVVGYLGDWRPAAAVLFERESLLGHPTPRREARQVAPTIPARSTGGGGLGTDFDCDGGVIQAYGGNNQAGPINVATARNACASASGRMDFESETFLVQPVHAFDARQSDVVQYGDMTGPLNTDGHTIGVMQPVAYALRADAARSGEAKNPSVDANGVSRLRDAGFNVEVERAPTLDCGTPHTVAFDTTQITSAANYSSPKPGDPCHPLAAGAHTLRVGSGASGDAVPMTMSAFGIQDDATPKAREEGAFCLRREAGGEGACVMTPAMQVRRLTPIECERLQGFPDEYTAIPWRGKPASECPDGPRYKALGNSMAVPCMRWIGERIAAVELIKGRT